MTIKFAVVGTQGGGSTRLYNLIRITFEKLNYNLDTFYGTESDKILNYQHIVDKDNTNTIILQKIHDCSLDELNTYNFIMLPVRHPLDCALSLNKRWQQTYIQVILENARLYRKFKSVSDVIFYYEKYSLEYVKQLYNQIEKKLDIKINFSDEQVALIIKELDELWKSDTLPEHGDHGLPIYIKTILSKHHNTSNGKSNKFIKDMTEAEIKSLLADKRVFENISELGYLDTVQQYITQPKN